MADMDLSEFIGLTKVKNNNNGSYSVTFTLKDGQDTTLTIEKCDSEFDANERAFLYLQSLIYKS